MCALLLLNDANYPWFILLPQREQITEIHQLNLQDQQQLLKESTFFSQCLEDLFQPDKLNIAALGNVVSQLHIHHIARFKTDACWPAPVWGAVDPITYSPDNVQLLTEQLLNWFGNHPEQTFRPI